MIAFALWIAASPLVGLVAGHCIRAGMVDEAQVQP